MKSSNRFLLWSGIAIAILVVVTITLVLTMQGGVSLLPENTPEGVVQRFLLALQDKDSEKAFSYLQIVENGKTLTYTDWYQFDYPHFRTSQTAWKATLGKTVITGNTATVEVFVDIFQPGGPFGNPVRTDDIGFKLTKTGDRWFISTRPPIYWLY